MLNKKFLLSTVLTAAVCLSACKKETELIDDFTTTAQPPQAIQDNAAGTANGAAKDRDGLPDIVINPDGGDPIYAGEAFVPIYSDENEILFKAVIIHCHDNSPYKIEFEERNFHMVNTEDGWKFDNFTYLG